MDYLDFSAEDFASNESFQDYFLHKQPEAVQFWTRWIEEHPDKATEIEAAKELLHKLALGIQPEDTQQALLELKRAIEGRENKAKIVSISKKRRYWVAAIAASILALVFLLPRLSDSGPEWIVYETDYGQLRDIYLPDSSMITMNSNSKIKYLANWENQKTREVWMEGEAFFDVRKNPKVGGPDFQVYAEEASIHVLGTSFNVYNRKQSIVVALATGSVNFSTPDESHKMVPQDVIEWREGNDTKILNGANLDLYTSWRNRRLVLDNTSISRIIKMLEENMGLEVIVDNPGVLDQHLTATLPINEVDILLTALTEIYGLDIRKEDNTVWIK